MTEDILILPGIQSGTAKKLIAGGFDTLDKIKDCEAEEIAERCGMGLETARKALKVAIDELMKSAFTNLNEKYDIEQKEIRLSTGSRELDALMLDPINEKKGLRPGVINQFYGKYGCGKTQVCFTLCITAQLPVESGGLDGEVLYLDTEQSSSASRITQMALARDYTPEQAEDVRKKVHYKRVTKSKDLVEILERLPEICEGKNIKLIIIDSMTALFRAEYTGRGTLAERQQMMNHALHKLQDYAEANQIVAVITNQIMSNPDASGPYSVESLPIGGHILGHTSKYIIQLNKMRDAQRKAKLMDAPDMPIREALFYITNKGVCDQ